MSALIAGVVKLLRQKVDAANLALKIQAGDLPAIRADERKLKQVLMNLLSNAVKFTPAGGTVTILGFVNANGDLVVDVSDTDIGMAPDEIPKAMAPFGQVDGTLARKHDGTGLGLPLVKALVEAHGGHFELISELGKGTACRNSSRPLIFPRD